jgi:hypothetical protein
LTRGKTLYSVHQVFVQILIAYAKALADRLYAACVHAVDPRRPETQRAAEIKCICLIVNTAEYCNETLGPLGESMAKALEDGFKDKVDMMDVEDAFSTVLAEALNKLMGVVELKSNILGGMLKVNWSTLDVVGDQSEYVDTFERTIAHALPVVRACVSSIHYTFFCEKFAGSLAPKLYIAVFKCKRFSETAGQQLLLDMHAVKMILSSLPSLGIDTDKVDSQTSSSSVTYAKMIAREMGKVEALIKVILSPSDGLAETFKALLPVTSNAVDFRVICELKGMKKSDIPEPPFGLFSGSSAPASTKSLDEAKLGASSRIAPPAIKMPPLFKQAGGSTTVPTGPSMMNSTGLR